MAAGITQTFVRIVNTCYILTMLDIFKILLEKYPESFIFIWSKKNDFFVFLWSVLTNKNINYLQQERKMLRKLKMSLGLSTLGKVTYSGLVFSFSWYRIQNKTSTYKRKETLTKSCAKRGWIDGQTLSKVLIWPAAVHLSSFFSPVWTHVIYRW